MTRAAISAFLLLLVVPPAQAELRVLADGKVVEPVSAMTARDDGRIALARSGTEPVVVERDRLAYLEAVVPSPRRPGGVWLALVEGTVLRGREVSVLADSVRIDSPRLGPVHVPFAGVVAFSVAPGVEAAPLLFTGETVVLANGDPLEGRVLSLGPDGVQAESLFGPMTFAWDQLRAVALRARGSVAAHPDALALVDGHELVGQVTQWGGDKVTLDVPGIGKSEVPLAEIRLACLGGHQARGLLADPPAESSSGTFALDRTLTGGPLCSGSRWYRQGIGAATAALVWRLPPDAAWLLVDAGVDEAAGETGAVAFVVEGDDAELAAHTARGTAEPARLAVPLAGRTWLRLRTTPSAAPGSLAVWGEPLLLRSK